MSDRSVMCSLAHERPRKAAVRLEVRSTRVGRAGRPAVRQAWLCTSHARELRHLGLGIVEV